MGTYEDALAEWGRHADAALAAERALVGEWTARAIAVEAEAAELRAALDACQGASLPLVPAVQADTVAAAYGVCAHVNFQTSVYGATAEWLGRVDSLGARYFRSMYAHNLPANTVAIAEARRLGLKWLATVSPEGWTQTDAQLRARLVHIRDNAADVVFAIEGVNEPNHERSGGPPPADWPERTLRVQRIIWDFVQAEMPHIAVVGPSLHATVSTAQRDQVRLGELGLGAFMDYAGLHRYFGGRYPDYLVDQRIGWIRDAYGPDMPVWVTETGYTNSVANLTAHKPVPEHVSAAYGPITLLEFFTRNCRSTRYELLDDPDPEKNDVESNFGLWRTPSLSPGTWTEKPEAATVRSFLASLSDPGPEFTPASVRLELTAPENVKSLVVGKRDGSHYLLLWQRAQIFDPGTQRDTPAADATVQVRRPGGTRSVAVPAGDVVTVRL